MAGQRLHILVLVSLIASALILGAWTRSASTPPPTAGVIGGAGTPEIPTPTPIPAPRGYLTFVDQAFGPCDMPYNDPDTRAVWIHFNYTIPAGDKYFYTTRYTLTGPGYSHTEYYMDPGQEDIGQHGGVYPNGPTFLDVPTGDLYWTVYLQASLFHDGPWADVDSFVSPTFNAPSCHVPVVTHEQMVEDDCEGWRVMETEYVDGVPGTPYVVAQGVWSDPYTLETASASGVDAEEDAWSFNAISENDVCLVQHTVQISRDIDCEGVRGWYQFDDGAPIIYQTLTWDDPDTLEQKFLDPIDVELPWGGTLHIDGFQVDEPAECSVVCTLTPLYHMFVLQDYDAPAGYLQGGTCYIISNGFPSVGRQAAICTYPFTGSGWEFRADRVPYAGYVYRGCHGNIGFGWDAWDDSWLRTDFNLEGRTSPRD
jgi:hypothetical protein